MDGNRIMDQGMYDNLCALTFDDGPGRNTPALLDMLASYGIKATFFLLGNHVRQMPDLAKRIQDEGHEIGNHSWSHPNLRTLSKDRQNEELVKTDNLLRSLGITSLYFRPPYGAFDTRTIAITNELGLDLILWSLDSNDWRSLPEDYAKLRSTRGTIYDEGTLRGIFLFHDTHKSTVDDLPRIIANLRAGGCDKFVTVSDYLAGLLDPEPALLMTRHEAEPPRPLAKAPIKKPEQPAYAAGTGEVPLARCSRPYNHAKQDRGLQLDEATAAAAASHGG